MNECIEAQRRAIKQAAMWRAEYAKWKQAGDSYRAGRALSNMQAWTKRADIMSAGIASCR